MTATIHDVSGRTYRSRIQPNRVSHPRRAGSKAGRDAKQPAANSAATRPARENCGGSHLPRRLARHLGGGGGGQSILDPAALRLDGSQPLQVLLKDRVCLHAVLEAGELQIKFAWSGLRQPVDHPLFVPMPLGQPMLAQVGKVLGNRDLRQLENRLEMADAERPLFEQVNDSQAILVAKAAVNLNERNFVHVNRRICRNMDKQGLFSLRYIPLRACCRP